jgi:limonene-1,2-epoxide hydrolase
MASASTNTAGDHQENMMTHPPTELDPGARVRAFVDTFHTKDADLLADYLHPDVVFRNYGEEEVHGRDALLRVWAGVFATFAVVRFETIHQAVDGPIVLAEQIHHLGLPAGPVAPVMNLAVYETADGLITAWRDYTNPDLARRLLRGDPVPA